MANDSVLISPHLYRILGSRNAYAISTTRLNTSNITQYSSATPSATVWSRLNALFTKKRPKPGRLKIFSTITDPVRTCALAGPKKVTTGRIATFRACLYTTALSGNPFARAVGRLRAALIAAVSDEDIGEIVHALVTEAKAGNVMAAREVLDRCLGRPVEADLLVRLEELEAAVAASQEQAP